MRLTRGMIAMDLFGDKSLVRLRSHVRRTYLHADEDGAGLSLRADGHVPSRNAVWRVRRLPCYRFLLQSTAFGSYLAVSDDPAPPRFGGLRALLHDYDGDVQTMSHLEDIVWRPAIADDEGDHTFIFLDQMGLNLRAGIWHTGVTVARASNDDPSYTLMRAHWAVEIITLPAPELPERLLLTYKLEESEEIPEPTPVEEEKAPVEEPVPVPPVTEVVSPPPKTEVADTGDLLGLDDPNPVVSAIEERNVHALAIVPTDGASTTGNTAFQDKGFDPTGWELSLVTAPSNTSSSASSSTLPEDKNGGFSKEMVCEAQDPWDLLETDLETDSLPSPRRLCHEQCNMGSDDSAFATTSPRSSTCLCCTKESINYVCDKCTTSIKKALQKAREAPLGTGTFSLCLKCTDLKRRDHGGGAHSSHCIPLDMFDGSQIAWVTKKETWRAMFSGIQSDRFLHNFLGRPFLIHRPQGRRCEVCCDHLSDDQLYGAIIQFCTIDCWAKQSEAAAQFNWVNELLRSDFDRSGEHCYFCNICRCAFTSEDEDHLHDPELQPLHVITDFVGGTAAVKIEVPASHFMASYWKCVKDLSGGETLSSPTHLFRLRDEGAQRCKGCKLRLEDGGGEACSFECSLPMLPDAQEPEI